MPNNAERRAYPRVKDEGLALKLNTGEFDMITHTLDVSASGLYCKVDKEIPLMSRVKMILMVPDTSGESKATKSVEVEGVVVREHPVIINGRKKHYDVAIFFDNLSPKNRDVIANYVLTKSSKE